MKVDSHFGGRHQTPDAQGAYQTPGNYAESTGGSGKMKRACCGRGCCAAGAFRKVNFDNLAYHFGQDQNTKSTFRQNIKV